MTPELPADPAAFLFPGQGAQHPDMLRPFADAPGYARCHARVCEIIGCDPIAAGDGELLRRNLVNSLLTVLASVACLELIRARNPQAELVATAGYSVGQWTALYASGALGEEDLFRVVAERARIMDECAAAYPPSGMLAVIGLRAEDVEAACQDAGEGEWAQLVNYNAPGQYTLSGSQQGLARVSERLAALRPKRLLSLPVAGAWHSRIMAGAVPPLERLLRTVPLGADRVPVIDNVSGGWLPEDAVQRRVTLAQQVARPVRWMQGVRTLAGAGVRCLIEVGYGDTLTRFGFFIDRSLHHQAAASPPRARG